MLALRPYMPLRMVLTVCGRCFSEDPDREIDYETDILQGNLVAMDGAVYLRRICRRGHGEVDQPVRGGPRAAGSTSSSGGRRPARSSPTRPAMRAPIPMGYARRPGRPADPALVRAAARHHRELQPRVPDLLRGRGPGIGRFARLPHILRSLDAAIEREGGRVDVLMLSGGEPTVHPEVLEIIEAATERNVTRVILNTNGDPDRQGRPVRGARSGALRGRVEVYLQFDGFELESHLYHRGEDLRDVKAEALRRLAAERVFTTLAVAVADGVNDREVGAIADYALATDYIAGVAFQPVFGSGRIEPDRPDAPRHDDGHAQPARRADRRSGRAATTSSRCRARIRTARRSPTSSGATAASGGPCRGCSARTA